MNKRATGNIGEELAVEFLLKKGFKILDRNYHCRIGEIDIIASKDMMISFFEVKYRTYSTYHNADFPIESAVGMIKKVRIIKAIQSWLVSHGYDEDVLEGIYVIYILNKFDSNVVKMVQLAL
jgi:putative endonuclease